MQIKNHWQDVRIHSFHEELVTTQATSNEVPVILCGQFLGVTGRQQPNTKKRLAGIKATHHE
jgi:hypothetical protein